MPPSDLDNTPDQRNGTRRRRMADDTCYLARDHWHPNTSVDDSIERLLTHPHIHIIESVHFTGISVHKVRITP